MNSFLKIRTNSQLKKNKSLRTSVPYHQSTTIGIIFSVEDKAKHELIKEFVHRLERDGKKVHVISFLPRNKDNYDFLFDFFTSKDISFWGKIEATAAVKFSQTSFDYLFCLDTKPGSYLRNILATSKAKCRIGKFSNSDQPFFEMMIDCNGSIKGLIEGIYTYTTQLK